ncbi:glycogen debranching protein GlgX [Blastopirellula sp. JC732]|uniref:Glycogen debranching protein GlgX n=1 Tax=Blastopirellula sediminis TaxID=2894196 RepID=A0A9X1MK59_9BACT|nr:glycogen debranching protein GlgX [Blastopirellula sediminis]MCC9609202.1 glycogen debranching protein GlgX [Blastopirellula sediminis]MCC9628021.1 glycogen debranching protein GlgX [Blastopirellula sediminis]
MLMVYPHPELQFTHILPYGAVLHERGVQFVVFSRHATAMRLLLYKSVEDTEPTEIIDFDRDTDRWGDIWSIFVPGVSAGQLYHFQAEGPYDPSRGLLFDGRARLIDPYAKALAGTFQAAYDGIVRPPKCVVVDDQFNWEGDRHLRRDLSESIIYEMHVKGFTGSETSGVKNPGTYAGVVEKIPYLKSLGVTAVELMPVHEFPIMDMMTGEKPSRTNYWGYDTMAFFAPHRGYAASKEPGGQVREFKEMVKALHQAGIEVILDVVFNHTCEGNEMGPILSFKGLENPVYYMLANGGSHYKNYSGCGNTVNGNHPIVREMIFHSLRHWVHNYHVDGFRFDLASILSRDRNGNLVPNPPLVEAIAEDPLLADTKIIAEAWDAAGAYQVGSFANLRWAEWNGRYRDDIRSYWRGDPGKLGALATRLAGSSDLYQPGGRQPYHSINFITSHDGFPMNDLVSYNEKHNDANGEHNRDGDNHNISYNYGVEGPTRRRSIEKTRQRQIKNMMTTLLLSQGVPMVLMGDECRRTQGGNNNAYCQDNEISYMNWKLVEKNADMRRFVKALIAFRRDQPTVRQKHFLSGKGTGRRGLYDVNWYSALGTAVNWDAAEGTLICVLAAPDQHNDPHGVGRDVLLVMNATASPAQFILPPVAKATSWRMFVDTAAEPPADVYPDLNGPRPPASGKFIMPERSMRVYVAAR